MSDGTVSPQVRWLDGLAPPALYLVLSVALTWPAAFHPRTAVPGGLRTDVADAWWTLWYTATAIAQGRLPGSVDGLLNFPAGGSLWPSDPLNGLIAAPLVLTVGAPAAWSVLCILHVAASGWATHLLANKLGGNGFIAGTLYAAAPISLSHLQNGASEAVAGTTLLPLAGLSLVSLAQQPGVARVLWASLCLGLSVIGHVYTGVSAFLLAGAMLVAGVAAMAPRARAWLLAASAGGALIAAGPAYFTLQVATSAENIVGIKNEKELKTIRRKIGPADPEVFIHPGPFRSPDFRVLSRYGEEFVHSSYLGFVPIGVALWGLRRRPRHPALWIAGGAGLILALGPVLTADGSPVILAGRRAIPLPYLLIEQLPGFSSLSLLWRLAQLASLCLALLAAVAITNPKLAVVVVVLGLAEIRLISPAANLPQHVDSTLSWVFSALRNADEGAVMNFPVVGSRGYLYEQTVHHKPVAGTLNFPNNATSRRVWKAAIDNASLPPTEFAALLAATAQDAGVRYLVVHTDARSFDDSMHTSAVRAIKAAFQPAWEDAGIRIYRFY